MSAVTASILTAVLAAGCAGDGSPAEGVAKPAPKRTIVLENSTYHPPVVRVRAGSRVTWINGGDTPHTAETDGVGFFDYDRTEHRAQGLFDLHTLQPGEAESVLFTRPGRYDYHSSLDTTMTGTVIVTGRRSR